MFTTTTPQEYFTLTQDYLKLFPKNEHDVRVVADKIKGVCISESSKALGMLKTYNKATSGDATPNDIAIANKQAQSLMVTARFAVFLSIPGAIFMLPVATKIAEDLGVEFIPESVYKEFMV
jgi:hypothetical protein